MPRQAVFRILSVFWISTVVPGISSIEDDFVRGRKFGGYRIVPKSCKDYTSPSKSNTGVCMFNYECTQNGGSVVGSCIHGFLFGACCKLLPGASVSTLNVPTSLYSSTNKPTSLPFILDKSSTKIYKPIVDYHPAAETILLHKNGSVVQDHIGPEEFSFFSKPQLKPTNFVPQKESTSHNSFTDLNKISTDSSYNSSNFNQINKQDTPSKNQVGSTKYANPSITRKPGNEYTNSFSNQSNSTLKHAGVSLVRSTTPTYTKTPTKKYSTQSPSYYESDNMVLVPTLTAGDKPQSEGQSNQESINHILSILNNSEHGSADPEPMVASTKSPSQSLYTWVSVDGKTEKTTSTNNYYYSSTTIKPTNNYFYSTGGTSGASISHTPAMGSSVTHHIPGPSFQVTPEIKITPKPPSSSLDPIPTVIVLSSLHTTQKPYHKPNYDHPSSTTVGYNKPAYQPSYQSSSTHKIKPITNSNTKYPSSTSSVQILYTSTMKPTNRPITQTSTITISPKPNSPKPTTGLQDAVLISVSSPKPQHDTATSKPDYSTSSLYHQHTVSQDTYPKPSYYPNPVLFSTPQQNPVINSTEDLIAFPPVRDPNVNFTATQGEKPLITATTTFGDYGDEDATPQLAVDEQLDTKVHVFVEKIVQSLQGNFEDLEKVLLTGENKQNITISNDPYPTKKPGANTTKRPPVKKPTKKPKPTKPLSSKPTTLNPYRPTPLYTTLTSILPNKKPTASSILYTPTTSEGYGITIPTKKPKPTKKPTTPPEVSVSSTTITVADIPADVPSTTQKPYDLSRECGVRPLARKNGRIVGGKGASFGEWPWQVLVKEATWLGLFTKNKCGGVLITNRYVITAAHCQPGFLANLVAVFGEYDISGELEAKRSISKNVRRVIVHRQYDAATFENDIALLELETPISYDSHIVPICMPKDDDDFTGRVATVSGWGRLKYGGGVPSVLQEVQVPVIENNVCQEMFQTAGHAKNIINSFLCAGYANGQRDSCEGDSGGPLMVEREDGHWVLAGTVSHGIKCAAPYLPGVYMRTTYYKPWLQTITGVQ